MDNGMDIVKAARSWVGTPFHHQGRMKRSQNRRGGCDCLGLLVGIAAELELTTARPPIRPLTAFDETDYGHVPDGKHLEAAFDALFSKITSDELAPGDVLLMRLDKAPQHVGIVSDYHAGGLGIIHALASARRVVEHALDATWQERIMQGYRI